MKFTLNRIAVILAFVAFYYFVLFAKTYTDPIVASVSWESWAFMFIPAAIAITIFMAIFIMFNTMVFAFILYALFGLEFKFED